MKIVGRTLNGEGVSVEPAFQSGDIYQSAWKYKKECQIANGNVNYYFILNECISPFKSITKNVSIQPN